jgi:hypothetical protein
VSRFLASLLLLMVSFPLITPAFADFDSNIPACCRRAKHACELAGHRHQGSGPRIAAPNCPEFPRTRATPASAKVTGLTLAAYTFDVAPASYSARQEQTQALYRISHSRTGQKRGPPSLLA